MNEQELRSLVAESVSKSEVCRKLGFPNNGKHLRKLQALIEEYALDTSHFTHSAAMRRTLGRYERVTKICPVCGDNFETLLGHSREKTTCSHACSNTFFRSGEANPNYKSNTEEWHYRKICFSKWKQKCAVCGFDKVVDVHHIDKNHNNNSIENLIPLCPNHHKMTHTKKYRSQMAKEIERIIRSVG